MEVIEYVNPVNQMLTTLTKMPWITKKCRKSAKILLFP